MGSELCPGGRPLTRHVAPTVTALLERLGPTPAFVVGPASDVLAWNAARERLVRPLGMLDGSALNLARHVFLHPLARTVYADGTGAADAQVSRLRTASARFGDDPGFAWLIDELLTRATNRPSVCPRWLIANR